MVHEVLVVVMKLILAAFYSLADKLQQAANEFHSDLNLFILNYG